MAKTPKDPSKPAAKPAARRAPRNAAAKPATRRKPPAPEPVAATSGDSPSAAPAPSPAPAPPPVRKARVAKPQATRAVRAPKPGPAQTVVKAAALALPGGAKAWTIGAVVAALGAGLAALLTRARIARPTAREGHEPVDLLQPDRDGPVKHDGERAPEAFRPDMTAPMTAAEREALRPPPGPGPA